VIQVLPAPSESGKASMARVLIEEGTLNGRQLWISTEELTPASAPGSTYSLEYTEGLRQTLERRRAREREANRSRMLIVGRGAPNMQNSASESGPNASSKSAGVESANAQEPTAPSSVVYPICGALTREGRPCQRRVKGGGFCYQHRDASAEPAPAPKRAKPKL
jgi:hypothetical protein